MFVQILTLPNFVAFMKIYNWDRKVEKSKGGKC